MLTFNKNDYFQYLYRTTAYSLGNNVDQKEYINKRRTEIRKCNHQFVLLQKGGWDNCGGFDSTDYEYEHHIVECIHCGLTNKYKKIEDIIHAPSGGIAFTSSQIGTSVETQEFDSYFSKDYSDKYDLNIISPIIINSKHIGLLCSIAKRINPLVDEEQLVEMMYILNMLETNKEKVTLNTIEEAKELIDRYCKFMIDERFSYLHGRFLNNTPKLIKKLTPPRNTGNK